MQIIEAGVFSKREQVYESKKVLVPSKVVQQFDVGTRNGNRLVL